MPAGAAPPEAEEVDVGAEEREMGFFGGGVWVLGWGGGGGVVSTGGWERSVPAGRMLIWAFVSGVYKITVRLICWEADSPTTCLPV